VARIDVVPTDQLPKLTPIKVWIPPPIIEDRIIINMIKCQNDLWISIGQESKSHLLRKLCQLKLGMGYLQLFIPNGSKGRDTG